MSHLIFRKFLYGLYLLIALCPLKLSAAEWSAQPSLAIGYSQNDNYYMSSVPKTVKVTDARPALNLRYATELTNVSLKGNWDFKTFSGETNMPDQTISVYELGVTHNTELNQFGFNASLTKDTTLTQEYDNESLGLVQTENDRNTWNATPTWLGIINEQSSIRVNYLYQMREYEAGTDRQLEDYDYNSVGATYFYNWTENSQIYLTLSQSKYKTDEKTLLPTYLFTATRQELLNTESDTTSYQLGLNHRLSETFNISLGYGDRTTDSTNTYQICSIPLFIFCTETGKSKTSSTTSSPVYSVSLTRNFEISSVKLNVSRTISASGLGYETQIDNISLAFANEVTENLDLTVNIAIEDREPASDLYAINDRQYYRGNISLGWDIDRKWKISGNYRRIKVRYEGSAYEPESNFYGVNIRYALDDFSMSR